MATNLDKIPSIDGMRLAARKRLPKAVFDFIDGGSDDENTLQRNRRDFADYHLQPNILNDVSSCSLQSGFLGASASMPVIISPTGLAGLAWPEAELLLATAAKEHDIPFTLAALGSCDIEEVAAVGHARKWFQFYVLKDRQITLQLIERAKQSGYETLVLTVDTAVVGKREKDVHNGFTVPLKWTPRTCWDMISHPQWSLATLRAGVPMMRSLTPYAQMDTRSATQHATWINDAFDPSVNWDDIKLIRDAWPHKLLIKGILRTDDADRALAAGFDGIVVSNHGGRQLDGALSSIRALDKISTHLDGKLPLILDSGVRRGSDVVKALCLGASAVMMGRPTLYGAAAAGQQGVDKVLSLMREEINRTLALMGVADINKLDRSYLLYEPQQSAIN
jgi:(S)-mandelate dehydrogenase